MPPEPFNFFETDPKRNFAPWFLWFCLALILLGLGTAGYFKYERHQIRKSMLAELKKSDEKLQTLKQQHASDPTINWKTYRNEDYGFEFNYPFEWEIDSGIYEDQLESLVLYHQKDAKYKFYGIRFILSDAESSGAPDLEDSAKTGVIKKKESVVFNNINWTLLDLYLEGYTHSPYVKSTYLVKDNKIYRFLEDTEEDYVPSKEFNEILSTFKFTEKDKPVACTTEAKQCPDGSYVGRTGPNCEFALCPP